MTMDLPRIHAPWDRDTVRRLNQYQTSGTFHPFTCINRPHFGDSEAVLVATSDGWICLECDYTQNWAHAFMADPKVIDGLPAIPYRGGA
jgi:hypothetical protein